MQNLPSIVSEVQADIWGELEFSYQDIFSDMLSSVGEFKYQSRKYETWKPRQANEATTGEIDSSKIVPSYDAIKYSNISLITIRAMRVVSEIL